MNTVHQITPIGCSLKLNAAEFQQIRQVLNRYCGIFLHEGKAALVQSRLMKCIRTHGFHSFSDYLKEVFADSSSDLFIEFIDVLTTNKTSFFREVNHFDFINNEIIPDLNGRDVKWWSAGCSTGEQAISCAITLLEAKQKAKILATDLSTKVLQFAKNGCYPADKVMDVPPVLLKKYFQQADRDFYPVNSIRKMVTYSQLNFLSDWPMKGPFQLIMCRNVMIYFTRETQQQIISKFHKLLEPGGYLFLGHSEGIPVGTSGFKYIAPAVYRKL